MLFMKLFKEKLQLTAKNKWQIVAITLTWLVTVHLLFSLLQNTLTNKTQRLITSQIETSINGLNYDNIIRTFNNLEKNRIINCLNVTLNENAAPFHEKTLFSTEAKNCNYHPLNLAGIFINTTITLPSNKTWLISFNLINDTSFYAMIWITRISGIFVILFGYFLIYLRNQRVLLMLEYEKKQILEKKMIYGRLAHDIRSPLSVINLLTGRISFNDSEVVTMFKDSVKKINHIADDLLNSELRSTTPALNLKDLANKITLLTREKKIEYNDAISFDFVEFSDIENIFIAGSIEEIIRIVSNLFNNSFEAAKGDKCTISIKIERRAHHIVLISADNGTGIDPIILKQIGQVEVTTKKYGHGIGLFSSMRYLKSINGHAEFETKENQGTKVSLFFPILS